MKIKNVRLTIYSLLTIWIFSCSSDGINKGNNWKNDIKNMCETKLKKNMLHDPNSYESISWTTKRLGHKTWNNGGWLESVDTTFKWWLFTNSFRGKNAFGVLRLNEYNFIIDSMATNPDSIIILTGEKE